MAGSWPIVKRSLEFDTIRAALTNPGDTCGVVVTGPAGVGKSTLARAAARSVQPDTRWFTGTASARSVPLGVFAHMVASTTTRDPVTLMSAARESLLGEADLVIGVDDAHLLDELSATLLLQLATDHSAHIVTAVRSGERAPDAVTSLWKEGHLRRLDLSPFDKQQSVDWVEGKLGGRLEALSADQIWNASGGNALHLRHYVEGALEAGTLREVGGFWQLRGRAGITSELASLLDDRIEALPAAVLSALKLVTLCEPIDIDLLTELSSEEAIDAAELAGLIRITREADTLEVRFQHPLLGEAVRRRMGIASSRRLKGQLVAALQTRGPVTPSERIRLAELAVDSDRSVDNALLTAAAEDAIALADLSLAERFARTAQAQGGGFDAAYTLAVALLWQGKPHEVERILTAYQPEELDQVQLLRWGATRASNLLWSMGSAEEADELFPLLRERVTYPSLVQIVDGCAAAVAFHENRLDEAVALAEPVLNEPRALPWAVEWAAFGGGRALALMGRGDEVAAIAAKVHASEDAGDGLLRFPVALGEIQALTLTGRLDAALRLATEYFRFCSGWQPHAWALANTLVCTVEIAQGRFTEATSRLEQTLAALPSNHAATWSFPARILLAQAYAALGRTIEARRVIDEAEERDGRHVAVFEPQLAIARAWLAGAEGAAAIELAYAAAAAAAKSGQYAIEAEALHTAARFGDGGAALRLAESAERIDGLLVGIQARHAAAVAANDGGALDAAAAEFERIGARLSAADAAAQAATAHELADDRGRMAAAAANANRLAALCGGAVTPALRVAAQPLPLTVREREIANLVAAGLSNRQIADRLTLSVRTVEGHVYRICTKLDVAGRDALAALILSGGGPSGQGGKSRGIE